MSKVKYRVMTIISMWKSPLLPEPGEVTRGRHGLTYMLQMIRDSFYKKPTANVWVAVVVR
jgi:hypothetical protein